MVKGQSPRTSANVKQNFQTWKGNIISEVCITDKSTEKTKISSYSFRGSNGELSIKTYHQEVPYIFLWIHPRSNGKRLSQFYILWREFTQSLWKQKRKHSINKANENIATNVKTPILRTEIMSKPWIVMLKFSSASITFDLVKDKRNISKP